MKIIKLNEDFQYNSQELINPLFSEFTKKFDENSKSYGNEVIDNLLKILSTTLPISSLSSLNDIRQAIETNFKTETDVSKIAALLSKYLNEWHKVMPASSNKQDFYKLNTLVSKISKRAYTALNTNDKMGEYKKLEEIYEELKKLFYEIDDELQNKLKEKTNGTTFNTIREIEKRVSKFKNEIRGIIFDLVNINTKEPNCYSNINTFADTLDEANENEIETEKYNAEVSKGINELNKINSKLPEVLFDAKMPLIDKSGDNKALQGLIATLDLIDVLRVDLEAISTYTETKNSTVTKLISKNQTFANKTNTTRDWRTLFKEAIKTDNPEETTNNLWDEYYKTEWKNNSAEIEGLGSIFKQELLALGFDELSNPFIPFLNYMVDKVDLTPKNYAAIHNALIEGFINNSDLRANGSSVLGHSNIIYNKELYTKSGSTIIEYLKLQAGIVNKYKGGGVGEYFANEELKDTYGSNNDQVAPIKQFTAVVFIEGKTPLKLQKFPDNQIENAIQNGSLKSITDIKNILITCFGESGVKAAWQQSTGSIIAKTLKSEDKIINALKFLVASFGVSEKVIGKYKEVKDSNPLYDIRLSQKLTALFSSYDITNTNVKEVIDDIAKAANFTKTNDTTI